MSAIDVALTVACPSCASPPHHSCVDANDNWRSPHPGRFVEARKVGEAVKALPDLPAPPMTSAEVRACADAADPVTRPKHYRVGGFECLDVIEALGLGFRLGNALKYLWRAGRKDKAAVVEDLRKARFYIDREIEKLEATAEIVAGAGVRRG